MSLESLVSYATHKERFETIQDYIDFCREYLNFIEVGLQATIISQNENHYRFYQYKSDGHYNVTRPINNSLMYDPATFEVDCIQFLQVLEQLRDEQAPDAAFRQIVVRTIYTIQQSIGATLDALPSGMSGKARKINGDLFERLICLIILALGIDCSTKTVQIPVKDNNGKVLFHKSYQHDFLIHEDDELKILGSVKTSSKDRIDKIFLDKFLYNKLTGTNLPHIAIFLNDVQRKGTKQKNRYSVNTTFKSGHFKAYTVGACHFFHKQLCSANE